MLRASLLVCFILLAISAEAAPLEVPSAAYPERRQEVSTYAVGWSGILLGEMTLSWEEDNGRYLAGFRLRTTGLARLFKKQDRSATVRGRVVRDADTVRFYPEHFHAESKTRHKMRIVDIDYDAKGNELKTLVQPPDNPTVRPPVSQAGKDRAIDPLTALMRVLSLVQSDVTAAKIPVYDGRRLTSIHLNKRKGSDGLCRSCVVYQLSRKLLEGFDPEDLEDFKKGDPQVFFMIDPAQSRFGEAMRIPLGLGELRVVRRK